MNNLDNLLKYVQRTNPNMTKKKLIEKLKENKYSATALILTWEINVNKNF